MLVVALVIVLVLLGIALAAAQVILPRLMEERVALRLTEHGGSAEVEIRSVPAVKLLRRQGALLKIIGRGIELGVPGGKGGGLARLDGFRQVEIDIADIHVGPLRASALRLARNGPGPYRLQLAALATPHSVASFGASMAGVKPLVEWLRSALAGGNLAAGIPIDLDLAIEAGEDGRARVVGGQATVAGFDATPVAEVLPAAVALVV